MEKEYDLNQLKIRKGSKSDSKASKTPISLRIDGGILALLKTEAHKRGLPYQTLISSILHQYANGELIESHLLDKLNK